MLCFLVILDFFINLLLKKFFSVLIFFLFSRKFNVLFSVKFRVVSRCLERFCKSFWCVVFVIDWNNGIIFDFKLVNVLLYKFKMSFRVTTFRSIVVRLAFSIIIGCFFLMYFCLNVLIDSVDVLMCLMLFYWKFGLFDDSSSGILLCCGVSIVGARLFRWWFLIFLLWLRLVWLFWIWIKDFRKDVIFWVLFGLMKFCVIVFNFLWFCIYGLKCDVFISRLVFSDFFMGYG